MESGLKSLIDGVLDLLFPEKCLGCGKKGSALCPLCIARLRRAERETNPHIIACFDYRDPVVKRAIWSLKYHTRRHLGSTLGELLYESLIEEIAEMREFTKGSPICVIPVPLSRTRKKKRGYNQAEVIARGFCRSGGQNIFEPRNDIIVKKIDTLQQARITNRTIRLRNISGAFHIEKPNDIKGRTIIIVDDVTTTGGTMNEIINVLKKSGAKKVVGFAVAH